MSAISVSEDTLRTLKNLASINQSLLFTSGNTLSTINSSNNVLCTAKISEDLPAEFGIYDLNNLLGTLSLFANPQLDINSSEGYMTIRDGENTGTTVKYTFASRNLIKVPPKNHITLPSEDVSFTLEADTLSKLQKASSVMGLQYLFVNGSDGVITVELGKPSDANSNRFRIVVGDTSHEFSFIFLMENIKLLHDDYNVVISSHCISQFTSSNSNRTYWISTETGSKFNS
tara:strand:- start:1633 stop:2322 length:690 start_codon:yes stop_codon:yes gene_type:complete